MKHYFLLLLILFCSYSCSETGDPISDELKKEDFEVSIKGDDIITRIHQEININIENLSDKEVVYEWFWNEATISEEEDLVYTPDQIGDYTLKVVITDFESSVEFIFNVSIKEGAMIYYPTGSKKASVNKPFIIRINSEEPATYQWFLDDKPFSTESEFNHIFTKSGSYEVRLEMTENGNVIDYEYTIAVIEPSPYITSVFEYRPAPGQFVNELPLYIHGDSQENMNQKTLNAIGNNTQQMVTLGSYGGYVIVGFNQTIENKAGLCDFRVLGNAFYANANPDEENLPGGSSEPGIIVVSRDVNNNGLPDDPWYEIKGSSHIDHTKELWYKKAVENSNDMNFYFQDFELTYTRPDSEPSKDKYETYIPWKDNKGNEGYVAKNTFHDQAYYPKWITDDKMTFKGSRLPQNGIDESGKGNYFVLYHCFYGYCDNGVNTDDDSAIDIDWAVDDKGAPANLEGVDFIKIYNGVNQVNGWLGECSTEVTGINNLHMLGETISSEQLETSF